MEMYHTLSCTAWECKYHVVFISKYRKKGLYDQLRKHLGPALKTLAAQKECQIEEGHLLPDNVHMLIEERLTWPVRAVLLGGNGSLRPFPNRFKERIAVDVSMDP